MEKVITYLAEVQVDSLITRDFLNKNHEQDGIDKVQCIQEISSFLLGNKQFLLGT